MLRVIYDYSQKRGIPPTSNQLWYEGWYNKWLERHGVGNVGAEKITGAEQLNYVIASLRRDGYIKPLEESLRYELTDKAVRFIRSKLMKPWQQWNYKRSPETTE